MPQKSKYRPPRRPMAPGRSFAAMSGGRNRAASLLMLAPGAAKASESEAPVAGDVGLLAVTLAGSMVLASDEPRAPIAGPVHCSLSGDNRRHLGRCGGAPIPRDPGRL